MHLFFFFCHLFSNLCCLHNPLEAHSNHYPQRSPQCDCINRLSLQIDTSKNTRRPVLVQLGIWSHHGPYMGQEPDQTITDIVELNIFISPLLSGRGRAGGERSLIVYPCVLPLVSPVPLSLPWGWVEGLSPPLLSSIILDYSENSILFATPSN